MAAEPGTVRILDGGLSTQLERHHGVDLSANREMWTAGLLLTPRGRDALEAAHCAFATAGADLILSGTYQASLAKLPAEALRGGVRAAVRAARRSTALHAGRRPPVEAWISMGPYGATLADGSEYSGSYEDSSVGDGGLLGFHERRLHALISSASEADNTAGYGGLAFETIPSAGEARAIASLLCSAAHGVSHTPSLLSLQCRDGDHLADGTPVGPLARELCDVLRARAAPTYIGANCMAPTIVDTLLEHLVPAAAAGGGALRGICIYPNDGGHWDAEAGAWEGARGRSFALDGSAARWRARVCDAGLDFLIGGCCATDESLVRELRGTLLTC